MNVQGNNTVENEGNNWEGEEPGANTVNVQADDDTGNQTNNEGGKDLNGNGNRSAHGEPNVW